jgi:hypothetical protein
MVEAQKDDVGRAKLLSLSPPYSQHQAAVSLLAPSPLAVRLLSVQRPKLNFCGFLVGMPRPFPPNFTPNLLNRWTQSVTEGRGRGVFEMVQAPVEEMSRAELQALAKQHGLKANMKSADLISLLRDRAACSSSSISRGEAGAARDPGENGRERAAATNPAPWPAKVGVAVAMVAVTGTSYYQEVKSPFRRLVPVYPRPLGKEENLIFIPSHTTGTALTGQQRGIAASAIFG